MFGTIRKHSKWLWLVVITLTIISFIYWGAGPGSNVGSVGGRTILGSIEGEPITNDDFNAAHREVLLRHYFQNGRWPDKAKQSGFDEERESYIRLLFIQKMETLGIHPSAEAVAKAASQLLRAFNRGNPIPVDVFAKEVLAPARLTLADFQRYMRHELGIQQLVAV